MRKHSFALISFAGLFLGIACSDGPKKGPASSDGYSGGNEPLALSSAPPGLCDGDGASKDCSTPGGCKDTSSGTGGGSAGGSGSYGYGGSSYGGSAGSSYGGSGGLSVGGSGGGAAGGPADAGCVPDPDAGTSCDDAGAAGSASTSAYVSKPTGITACEGLATSTPAVLYQSADDSNSTASPVIARRQIRAGLEVPAHVIRPWEFLNYYDFSFEPAPAGQVRIVPQLSSCPTNGQLAFQVGLQAEARQPSARRALNVTFVLDTSGSMDAGHIDGITAIELERSAVLAMAKQLRQGDVVSAVTWNTGQNELLAGHIVSGPSDPALVALANSLTADGGTDLQAGLQSGYALAKQHYSPELINRVVLISDGQANVGITDEELIGKEADDEEGQEGIYLSGIGVGSGVNDTLMNVVTDVGRGAYVYLDGKAEAEKMLGDRFLQVIDLAARSVRLEVTLPWYMQVRKFYGEAISTDPTKVRPQHLGPNDAMLFFQVLSACDSSLIHGDDRIRMRATWETPFTHEPREAIVDTTFNELAGNDANLTKAAAVAGYAEALILVAVLPDTEARKLALAKALQNVEAAQGAKTDPDLIEIAELLKTYALSL